MVSSMLEDEEDSFVQADVESLARDPMIPWDTFHGKTILVTGATGLIGSQLIKAIACHNRLFIANINIIALARNASKAKKIFANILDRNDFKIVIGDITTSFNINLKTDFIIHGASATASREFISKPVETIQTSVQGTINILNYAKKSDVKGVVYLSSLEYYGIPQQSAIDVTENDLGYIDPLQTRSSYSEGKRMSECLCTSYFSEYDVPITIARLAQIFGPGIPAEDNRIFAQFSKNIINKQNLILKTTGETIHNYCYTADAISAILFLLAKGKRGEAYNVANKGTTKSIAEMAEFICQNFGNNISKVVFDISENSKNSGFAPTVKIALKTDKINQLGWNAQRDLFNMLNNMIGSMKFRLPNHSSK